MMNRSCVEKTAFVKPKPGELGFPTEAPTCLLWRHRPLRRGLLKRGLRRFEWNWEERAYHKRVYQLEGMKRERIKERKNICGLDLFACQGSEPYDLHEAIFGLPSSSVYLFKEFAHIN